MKNIIRKTASVVAVGWSALLDALPVNTVLMLGFLSAMLVDYIHHHGLNLDLSDVLVYCLAINLGGSGLMLLKRRYQCGGKEVARDANNKTRPELNNNMIQLFWVKAFANRLILFGTFNLESNKFLRELFGRCRDGDSWIHKLTMNVASNVQAQAQPPERDMNCKDDVRVS